MKNQGTATNDVRIIGIDPGVASVGYGVIDWLSKSQFHYVTSGIIQTPSHMEAGHRLKMIRLDLLSLFDEFQPDALAIEALFFFRNAKTMTAVAQARGVILEASAHWGVNVAEYTPMQAKLSLTGFGRADKREVQLSIARLFQHQRLIKPDDAADAVALAICHARMFITKHRLPDYVPLTKSSPS